MASLKEIRGRISSIQSTRKITSAMKMVSASKLKRAQQAVENYIPYMEQLTGIADSFVDTKDEALLPVTEERALQNVAIVAFASNGSLCGAFNSNVLKKLQEMMNEYRGEVPQCHITIYAIGKKVADWANKNNISYKVPSADLTEKPSYQTAADIADKLTTHFREKKFDKIEIVYNHFKNAAVQQIRRETLLPIAPMESKGTNIDYIVEPTRAELINVLIPKLLRLQVYGALLDSIASEHGARTTAMQMATENADQLVQDLNLQYNKMRQGAITKELLDIIGGSAVA
ncbi:MAG: ATP synthase F1 subunit gamma [Prevotellaceae bacterium]|nr:ATP synthase F1 subunit gamma [Prevotellaceae bacterium]